MAKHSSIVSSLLIIVSLLPIAYSARPWTKDTKIRVYLQDSFNTSQSVKYGDVFGFQDPLTSGPSPRSPPVGRAQGTIAFSNRTSPQDLHMSIAYVFTNGPYKGSTLVAEGRNEMALDRREFPIIGGTGYFKYARGMVIGSTYSRSPPIYIYDLEVTQDNFSGSQMYDGGVV